MKSFAKILFLLSLFVVVPAAFAQDAKEILARAKQASGGAAWVRIRTTHTQVKVAVGGLTGTAESWEDTRTGRYVDRFALGPASGANGFDGKVVWEQDASKHSRPEEGAEGREAASNEAFRRSLAYWFPERWPAAVEYAGEKEDGGRRFHVLRITPKGGRLFDLWVDAETFLFNRTVEKAALEIRTTFFSDYREVSGVEVPFSVRSTNGETQYDQFITVEKVEFNVAIDAAMFATPAPPPPDFAFVGGATSATVPFELVNNHIYIQARLNGRGPFRMLCDTGGANIVTPELAKELGLKQEGALQGRGVGEKSEDVGLTKIDSLAIGGVTLREQLFAVFPLASFAQVEGLRVDGLVGYEIFKRFVVRVDYERGQLTLFLPSAFSYRGSGTVVPFVFNGQIPQVEGEIDGIPGKFNIDTGSRSSLDLLGPFVEKHNLKARYNAKLEAVTGWGVGGAARSLVTRAKELRLGGVRVGNPIAELSLQKKGAFTDPYVAGNVGAGVLKRFNIVFDYGRKHLIFEKNANYAIPDAFDRAGMWLNQAGDAFEVVDVVAGGPAAEAGIAKGDKIVAVDGRAAAQLSLWAVRARFKSDLPGTKVRVARERAGQKSEVALTLRDLI